MAHITIDITDARKEDLAMLKDYLQDNHWDFEVTSYEDEGSTSIEDLRPGMSVILLDSSLCTPDFEDGGVYHIDHIKPDLKLVEISNGDYTQIVFPDQIKIRFI